MTSQSEQRQFIRMDINQAVSYKFFDSLQTYHGICKNLSSSGLLFITQYPIDLGVFLEIQVTSKNTLAASSLNALVEVIRAKPISDDNYEVATQIKGIR